MTAEAAWPRGQALPLAAANARLHRWQRPLAQHFLGQMLGVRRTSVTIAARLLQNAGLIRYRRGHIQTGPTNFPDLLLSDRDVSELGSLWVCPSL